MKSKSNFELITFNITAGGNEYAIGLNQTLYIKYVEDLISPDLIIFGGGISKYFNEYNSLLKSRSKILPAKLENDAGIIGAALYTSLSLE